MTPDGFFQPKLGQSLLIPGQSDVYRGQCVQSVGLWVEALGLGFPTFGSAFEYYEEGIAGFDKIPAGKPIKQGDIVIWGPSFPPSEGNGHIDVAAADGSQADFWAYDSNWSPPLKLEKIHHIGSQNNYIIGYLRKQEVDMPTVVDQNILEDLTVLALDRTSVGDPNLKNLIGEDVASAIRYFVTLPEHKALIARADGSAPNGYPGSSSATVLKPGVYEVQ